jgi:hypothetical protein
MRDTTGSETAERPILADDEGWGQKRARRKYVSYHITSMSSVISNLAGLTVKRCKLRMDME